MNNLSTAATMVLSNYATFSGRASRAEFWWWWLCVLLVMFAMGVLDALIVAPLLGFDVGDEDSGTPLSVVVAIGLFLPNLAVAARRLHDIGKSAWWLFLGLVPVIGFLVLLYFYIQPGDEGENAFGIPSPFQA